MVEDVFQVKHARHLVVRTSRPAGIYQIVWIAEARILRSRETTGKPRWSAVAAMIRSGMSGTSALGTRRRAWAISASRGARTRRYFGSASVAINRSNVAGGM